MSSAITTLLDALREVKEEKEADMSTEIERKECSNCKTEYPATLEFFYNDVRSKNGLTSWCKQCQRKKQRYRDRVRRGPAKTDPDGSDMLVLDFTGHSDLLDRVMKAAADEMRTPAMQVLWWLSRREPA